MTDWLIDWKCSLPAYIYCMPADLHCFGLIHRWTFNMWYQYVPGWGWFEYIGEKVCFVFHRAKQLFMKRHNLRIHAHWAAEVDLLGLQVPVLVTTWARHAGHRVRECAVCGPMTRSVWRQILLSRDLTARTSRPCRCLSVLNAVGVFTDKTSGSHVNCPLD